VPSALARPTGCVCLATALLQVRSVGGRDAGKLPRVLQSEWNEAVRSCASAQSIWARVDPPLDPPAVSCLPVYTPECTPRGAPPGFFRLLLVLRCCNGCGTGRQCRSESRTGTATRRAPRRSVGQATRTLPARDRPRAIARDRRTPFRRVLQPGADLRHGLTHRQPDADIAGLGPSFGRRLVERDRDRPKLKHHGPCGCEGMWPGGLGRDPSWARLPGWRHSASRRRSDWGRKDSGAGPAGCPRVVHASARVGDAVLVWLRC